MNATNEQNETDWADKIGKPSYESIAAMVAALQCDYDRLEELRDERDAWGTEDNGNHLWAEEHPEDAKELNELEDAAGDCTSEEDARQRIDEDPLSLQVRSGWYSPGAEAEAEEFELLLGTGGPAVRIVGELDRGEPSNPRLQVQDWFKPWTEYFDVDRNVLLAYCQCFYFGD